MGGSVSGGAQFLRFLKETGDDEAQFLRKQMN
jgi:hypothetical protein